MKDCIKVVFVLFFSICFYNVKAGKVKVIHRTVIDNGGGDYDKSKRVESTRNHVTYGRVEHVSIHCEGKGDNPCPLEGMVPQEEEVDEFASFSLGVANDMRVLYFDVMEEAKSGANAGVKSVICKVVTGTGSIVTYHLTAVWQKVGDTVTVELREDEVCAAD